MRLTWVQPEDLVGHALRQAREEGRDVRNAASRWRAAGGQEAPVRAGASDDPAPRSLRPLAEQLLDELAAGDSPETGDEPDAPGAYLPSPGASGGPPRAELAERIHGAWLGRAAGCLLGKPVEKLPRQGIRELLEASGRWPLDGWFTARGLPAEVAARWPWNRRSAATSLAETIDGMPEDDDLNYTLLALHLLEQHGDDLSTEDVAQAWLDLMPAGRSFTAERLAYRNLLLGLVPPETATYRNPFREWIGARIRVELYGWARPGNPGAAAELAYRDARLSHTANGVYAATFMAAASAASVAGAAPAACVDAGLEAVPPRSRLAGAIGHARTLAESDGDWERVVDGLEQAFGDLHWVHAINNTALVAAVLCRFGDDYSAAICAAVAAGWDTDSNGAAVGSILGARVGAAGIPERWTAPLHDRLATSLPGFDRASLSGLAERTLQVAA